MKQHFIYITTNKLNGMKYIGKHYGEIDDGYLGSGTILKRAIAKYGTNNFSREIIDFSQDDVENSEKEKYYIALYNATSNPMFYNIHEGGNGGNTLAGYTDEQRIELSLKMSELTRGEKNGMYGKKHSIQCREYLSFWASQIRDNSIYRTQEFKDKMSAVTSGENNGMYGKKHSEQSKKLMSEKKIGLLTGNKNGMYGKTGNNALNGKALYAYDENNQLVHTFKTRSLALEFLGLKGHTKLMKCIDKDILYYGYYWKTNK